MSSWNRSLRGLSFDSDWLRKPETTFLGFGFIGTETISIKRELMK
jgi:hypothetical protein